MSSTSLRLRFFKNLRGRWSLICLFVDDHDSLLFDFVEITSSGLSLPRWFCRNLERRCRLIRFFLRRCSPPDSCMQSPWRCFLKLFVPVNLIPSIIIANFVAMMRFDSVYLRSMGEVVVLAAMKGLWRRWWTEAHGFACRIWWLNSPNCHRPSSIVQLQRSLLYSV